jgi:CheY-like chemotaxis protein
MTVEASDGPSGMRILQSAARIDLLITDVGLPNGMNGRQIAEPARQTRPGLKVLFITGYAENAVVGNGAFGQGNAGDRKALRNGGACPKNKGTCPRLIKQAMSGDRHRDAAPRQVGRRDVRRPHRQGTVCEVMLYAIFSQRRVRL